VSDQLSGDGFSEQRLRRWLPLQCRAEILAVPTVLLLALVLVVGDLGVNVCVADVPVLLQPPGDQVSVT
jgi:hypothetical protein